MSVSNSDLLKNREAFLFVIPKNDILLSRFHRLACSATAQRGGNSDKGTQAGYESPHFNTLH